MCAFLVNWDIPRVFSKRINNRYILLATTSHLFNTFVKSELTAKKQMGTAASHPFPHLSDCKVYFGGHGHENVESFIYLIQEYKDRRYICDPVALDEMKRLLYGPALLWWKKQKKRKMLKDWETAMALLKDEFKVKQ